jgi:putative solute:sodium symporter small subunit
MVPPSPHLPTLSSQAADYWRRKRRLTLQLLAVWLASTFSVIYFARELDKMQLFGWPLSYYMGGQCLALVYLALIVIYIRRIGKMERDMQAATPLSSAPPEKNNAEKEDETDAG